MESIEAAKTMLRHTPAMVVHGAGGLATGHYIGLASSKLPAHCSLRPTPEGFQLEGENQGVKYSGIAISGSDPDVFSRVILAFQKTSRHTVLH